MGTLHEDVAGVGESLVVLGSSFDGSGFGSVGTVGDGVSGEAFEEGVDGLAPPVRQAFPKQKRILKGMQPFVLIGLSC